VAFSPDGKTVASGGIGDVIILWAVQTGQPVKEFYTRVDFIQSLEFSPNGASLASVGANGEVLLWPVQ
jgi:WD40 repeat protein